jgi:hypothetical protein
MWMARHPGVRWRGAATLLLLLLALPAFAQPGPRPAAARGAADDTVTFIPRWLHAWFELGGGWLAGPRYLHQHYESGQSMSAGLEAWPRHKLALRGAIDYQTLLANRSIDQVVIVPTSVAGEVMLDTVPYTYQTSAWRGTARVELGVGLPGGFWLTGGGGGGYMNSGFSGFEDYVPPGVTPNVPAPLRNGWGGSWTAAARWDFQPAPMVPLGIDVRHTTLRRSGVDIRFWSIRLCYRVPDLPKSPGRRGRDHPGR